MLLAQKQCLSLKQRLSLQYVGQTTPKVKEAIADAMGGCLFLVSAEQFPQRSVCDDGVFPFRGALW